ncbi:MAG: PD40 domain-containing protein [Bacteroidales bacterium]|nr:PD40 domain-containing protein [Bacteroidales bacterium]
MMIRGRKHIILSLSILCILNSISVSCRKNPQEKLLLVTIAKTGRPDPDFISGKSWRFVDGAQIATVNLNKPSRLRILTGDFHSACYPEVSYDGKRILFTARINENDPWQIWEMKLSTGKTRKIISLSENCVDPVYLPGDRIAFSRHIVNDTVGEGHSLFTCNMYGSNLKQITFYPGNYFAPAVLKDGRILALSRQLTPSVKDPVLTVMRPDGTKADMFFKADPEKVIVNRPRETDDGRILLVEKYKGSDSPDNLISINYNRPLHTKKILSSGAKGSFKAVLPLGSGKFMVSFREPESDKYSVREFNAETGTPDKVVFELKDHDVLDLAIAGEYQRPKKLPSEVDLQVKTGLLMCQDINFHGFISDAGSNVMPRASKIEILGIDSTYGIVPVEKDGSFYLKVLADKPFRIRSLDENNRVLSGECSWMWLRPNERRGCVGCHEDPETVPVNRIPLAVTKDPVIIPVHITEVREKSVELE